LLVEQPFLSKEGKAVQAANICFECGHLQMHPTAVGCTEQQSAATCEKNLQEVCPLAFGLGLGLLDCASTFEKSKAPCWQQQL